MLKKMIGMSGQPIWEVFRETWFENWGRSVLSEKKHRKPENKRHATVKVFQVGNLLPLAFLKAFIHFPYVFSRHKGYKEKNNMTATFKYSVNFQCTHDNGVSIVGTSDGMPDF